MAFYNREKRIPLDELMQKYLDDPLHNIFPKDKLKTENTPDTIESNILPDRFVFIGEVAETEEIIEYYGRRVKQNIQLGFSMNEDEDEVPYK